MTIEGYLREHGPATETQIAAATGETAHFTVVFLREAGDRGWLARCQDGRWQIPGSPGRPEDAGERPYSPPETGDPRFYKFTLTVWVESASLHDAESQLHARIPFAYEKTSVLVNSGPPETGEKS